jgi:hypothetical protein
MKQHHTNTPQANDAAIETMLALIVGEQPAPTRGIYAIASEFVADFDSVSDTSPLEFLAVSDTAPKELGAKYTNPGSGNRQLSPSRLESWRLTSWCQTPNLITG